MNEREYLKSIEGTNEIVCEYHKSYCEIIVRGEDGYHESSEELKTCFDEMEIKEEHGWPYNNKYYWVGMMLSLNGNCDCKEE